MSQLRLNRDAETRRREYLLDKLRLFFFSAELPFLNFIFRYAHIRDASIEGMKRDIRTKGEHYCIYSTKESP